VNLCVSNISTNFTTLLVSHSDLLELLLVLAHFCIGFLCTRLKSYYALTISVNRLTLKHRPGAEKRVCYNLK
jgi:hypothetical protein